MDTLQIQDSFQPYYADRSRRIEVDRIAANDRQVDANTIDIAGRLKRCRARLAEAIAAESAHR